MWLILLLGKWQLIDAEQVKDATSEKLRRCYCFFVHVGFICCANAKAGIEMEFIFLLEHRGTCVSDQQSTDPWHGLLDKIKKKIEPYLMWFCQSILALKIICSMVTLEWHLQTSSHFTVQAHKSSSKPSISAAEISVIFCSANYFQNMFLLQVIFLFSFWLYLNCWVIDISVFLHFQFFYSIRYCITGEGGNFPKASWFLLVLYCATVVLRM